MFINNILNIIKKNSTEFDHKKPYFKLSIQSLQKSNIILVMNKYFTIRILIRRAQCKKKSKSLKCCIKLKIFTFNVGQDSKHIFDACGTTNILNFESSEPEMEVNVESNQKTQKSKNDDIEMMAIKFVVQDRLHPFHKLNGVTTSIDISKVLNEIPREKLTKGTIFHEKSFRVPKLKAVKIEKRTY
ncbi:hypothetical protein BpHYR1_041490 [Brachionus plicatilis]|uniref:Uncharacterized protein n=1 Tax=Brachionus plicatilis TaxID=10195 RepID=A0A3M7S7B7_BRAPC|nr:hypothetical protein BpHYR1_041490 [Brachionus plicatilis]